MHREDVEGAVRRLAPRIPSFELGSVVDHAFKSPALRKASPEEAAWLSLVAFIRHRMTDYDSLLAEGYDAESARHFVAEDMTTVLSGWGAKRTL